MSIDIAIIGMAGKYPKANSPQELWHNIIDDLDVSKSEHFKDENYVNKYYALDNVDLFDNKFFGYTPYEASIMDPQHRILLKCAREALANAGYEQEPCNSKIGVFVTTSISTYLINIILKSKEGRSTLVDYPILIGNDKDFISTKISYKLNLTGPSVTIQCACSSSLVALHYAHQSLLNRDCDMALVGGVSISIPQEKGYYYKEGGILSKDGICRPFDEAADGTIKGNGCSVVVLKRALDAINDKDSIYSVIKSTAANNDGANKIGYTSPSIDGESSVIEQALKRANLTVDDIDYIESHGTATRLGDAIEIKSLSNLFQTKRKLPLGSIKANIGHLDVAAGITSVIKSTFILNEGIIPPIRNFNKVNTIADQIAHNFEFPTKALKRDANYISVSSFGIGGTNAHAIIAKHRKDEKSTRSLLPYYFIPIQLNSIEDLESYIKEIQNNIHKVHNFCDFVFTMSANIKRKNIILDIIARDASEFLLKLENMDFSQFNNRISIPLFSIEEYKELRSYFPSFDILCSELENIGLPGGIDKYHLAFIKFMINLNAINSENVLRTPLDNHLVNLLQAGKYQEGLQAIKIGSNERMDSSELSLLEKLYEFLSAANLDTQIDFQCLYKGLNWGRVPLPNYPLREKRYWVEPEETKENILPKTSYAPHKAANNILDELINIWAEIIGDPSIAPDTNYLDIGGDSLMAIDIIDKINTRLNVKINTHDFTNNLTPRALEMLIKSKLSSYTFNAISHIRKSKDSKKSVFLIHPAGGTTFCYNMMNMHLKSDAYNLYAIDLPNNYQDFSSMEQLASRYLSEIKRYQSSGPYIIGGYSFGGNLAYEIAMQLEDENQQVDKVIMFDSHPPLAYNSYSGDEVNYVEAFPSILNYYLNPKNKKMIGIEDCKNKSELEVIEIMKNKGIIEKDFNSNEIVEFYSKWIFNHKLLKNHKPKMHTSADLIVFRAKEAEDMNILDSLKINYINKDLWKNYFVGNVDIVDIDGNHYSVFSDKDNLKYLAEKFESIMIG